jgi:hypothetical protein
VRRHPLELPEQRTLVGQRPGCPLDEVDALQDPVELGARQKDEQDLAGRVAVGGDSRADFGSVMPVLSVGVRWGRAIGWVCKPGSPVHLTGVARVWGNAEEGM